MAWGQGVDRRLLPATTLSGEIRSIVSFPAETSTQTDINGFPGLEIAVVIPCLDEELAVGQVVADVKAILFCTKYARISRYPGRAPFLAARLMAGDPPGWLTPIMIGKGFGLYAVKRSATGGQP